VTADRRDPGWNAEEDGSDDNAAGAIVCAFGAARCKLEEGGALSIHGCSGQLSDHAHNDAS
jgi:hypothetical protein